MRVTASCNGSCGELIQGWLGDSQKLVSYGIDRFSKVTIQTGVASKVIKPKVEEAIYRTLDHLGIPISEKEKLSFLIDSDLPVAKGMASSTADIAAACQATAAYYGRKISRDEIINICLAIERTDSILFPTLTLFEQKNGSVRECSGWAPHFYVVVLETEETLATEVFHSRKTDRLFYQQREQFADVYRKYEIAVNERSLRKLGEAATCSARLNQAILPKPYFSELLTLRRNYQWLGINVAHSGSVVGLMIEKLDEIPTALAAIKKSGMIRCYSKVSVHQSCYQGVRLIEAGDVNEKGDDCRGFQRFGENYDNTGFNEAVAKSRVSNSTL
ncbi:GHMP family kinase ATP-binding protein [Enterococcus sp. DIV0756]|uniref:GHMP family kinase ATP-binding protein n=1 Tax=Enterococcus sp. DIV0756 TaxID=2774636 RepID=UPI003F1F6A84